MGRAGAVLVVEDDFLIREWLAEALSADGFEVRGAANGRQALAVLSRWRPDLILLDLDMPSMDGRAFRAEQLSIPELAAIPVVLLSGAADTQPELAALQPQAQLTKPCDLELLAATIRRLCSCAQGTTDR
jgi:DNA-binding response OmpR family regulator